jgi:hypothetical protein
LITESVGAAFSSQPSRQREQRLESNFQRCGYLPLFQLRFCDRLTRACSSRLGFQSNL